MGQGYYTHVYLQFHTCTNTCTIHIHICTHTHLHTHAHTHTHTHTHVHTLMHTHLLTVFQKQQFLDYLSAIMPHIKQSNTYKLLHAAYSQLLPETNLYFNFPVCTCANGVSIFAVLYVLLNLMEWLVHFVDTSDIMHLW